MWCLSRIRLDPEILDPAGSGYQPDPDILDPTGSGSQPDPQFLDPAESGSVPDPQNLPDIRPDPDPVHPQLHRHVKLSVVVNTWTSERQMRSEHTALITNSLYHDTTSL